jgi:ABC-2 type transport system permease protein
MLVYIVGMFARGTMAEVLSYVPIASTVVMPGRLLNGEATWIHAVASLVVSGLFMIVAIWFGEQVYRRGLLQTNAVMSLKDAFRRTADAG